MGTRTARPRSCSGITLEFCTRTGRLIGSVGTRRTRFGSRADGSNRALRTVLATPQANWM